MRLLGRFVSKVVDVGLFKFSDFRFVRAISIDDSKYRAATTGAISLGTIQMTTALKDW